MDTKSIAITPVQKRPEDVAFLVMGGQEYLVVPLPATTVENWRKAANMTVMPQPDAAKDAVAAIDPSTNGDNPAPKRRFVYGLKGICELFGCSKSTAYNIKKSGKIDGAISQIGNTIVVDADRALELAKK